MSFLQGSLKVGFILLFSGLSCITAAADVAVAGETETETEVEDRSFDAKVNRDYIEVRTGPGRGYPVHQIVQQDEWLNFLKQKTNWIYVESEKGITGWLHSVELPNFESPDGQPYKAGVTDVQPDEDYFELGLQAGDFGGSQLLSLSAAYAFTPQISLEATLAEAIGNFSTTYYFGYQAMHYARSIKGFRPYLFLGAGRVFIEPSARIVKPEDQEDDFLKAGLGVRKHIDGRFYMKFEYGAYLVLRSQDDNDEINEWKLGISAVF